MGRSSTWVCTHRWSQLCASVPMAWSTGWGAGSRSGSGGTGGEGGTSRYPIGGMIPDIEVIVKQKIVLSAVLIYSYMVRILRSNSVPIAILFLRRRPSVVSHAGCRTMRRPTPVRSGRIGIASVWPLHTYGGSANLRPAGRRTQTQASLQTADDAVGT